MAELRPHQLLQELDDLLAENPRTPSCREYLSDEDYTLQHIQWHKRVRRESLHSLS